VAHQLNEAKRHMLFLQFGPETASEQIRFVFQQL
jgi:hypothetical protein